MQDIIVFLTAIASLTIANATRADEPLTAEEQALLDKGATMEMYEPNEHSRHFISHIEAFADKNRQHTRTLANPEPVLTFVFGMEDAEPAREEGKNMAESHYSPDMAQQFLFAQGWDKYHDRFFTRAYVQEGLDAYHKARRQGE